jgi:hypothetical protein
MKLRRKHRPLFSGRGLGFLFGIVLAMALLLVPMGDANSSVIKMPKPLPDIVKSYKSIRVVAGFSGMRNSGMEVKRGDCITILAKGAINTWPAKGNEYLFDPKSIFWFRLGENNLARKYIGPELIEIQQDGKIYLGYRGFRTGIDPYGEITDLAVSRAYEDDYGFFDVDILIWKKNDPQQIARFFEETSASHPKDNVLREIAQEFRERQRVLLALQEKTTEVEKIKKELSIVETKEISEIKREEKKASIPPKEKEAQRIKDNDKEKATEELTERLQKALQAIKELEDTKKKLSEQEEKEAKLLARLESMERERSIQSKNLPVIAIANPRDGISVDSEYLSLFGVAEHEKGISKFEILVNNKPVGLKGNRDLQLAPKDRKRIEFSERIRLREGQNTISIAVQGTEGLTNQKTISIQLAKKREKVYAVVIGINKYKNLPSLKYAVNDAHEFYRYLTEVNQVPKDHVWLLLDEEATLDKLRSTLGTLLRRSAGRDDTVIIFLAGHGATETDPSSPDGDGLEKYILPCNADPKDLYATAMPMSEVARIFQRISSDRLVFIGDTCYSGASGGRTILAGGTRVTVSGAFLERLSQGKGRVILTASDANEVSVEKDELGHGVFTYYLLEGLRGKADLDGDGMITVDEIYHYVSEKVPQATGQDQHPVRKGETTGQIVLGVVK